MTPTEDGQRCTGLRDSLETGLDMMQGMERDGLRVTSTLLVVQMDRWWCQLLGEKDSARGLDLKKKKS